MTSRFVCLNIALIAVLSLFACGGTVASPSLVPATPPASLAIEAHVVWHLRSMTSADGSFLAIEDPSLFTLTLGDDGKLDARADCNRASSGYRTNGNTLSIGPIASTRAYCTTAPVDQQFLMLLGGENSVTTSDATLRLSSSRGSLTFGR